MWIFEKFKDFISRKENILSEMANLQMFYTGLPFVIFINSGEATSQHAARIKVVKSNNDIFTNEMLALIQPYQETQ